MHIATLIRSYGLTKYLKPVIQQYSWVDKILVMNYRFKDVKPREDNTRDIALSLKLPQLEIESGDTTDLHQTLNMGLDRLKDYDLVFISDADELITQADQKKLVAGMEKQQVGKCKILDYARDYNHIFPIRGHEPVTIIRPSVKFTDVRCVGVPTYCVPDTYVHHFGYVYEPEEMNWKIDWERPWEHNTVINLLAQIPQPYEMPEEIKGMLNG